MSMFDKDSFSKLSTCHADLQAIFFDVIKHIECAVTKGYREHDDSDINCKYSLQPAMAIEVIKNIPNDYYNDDEIYIFLGFVLGVSAKLRDDGKINHTIIGGVLKKEDDYVLYHFELVY